jgi:site-specific recombinase XerD
MFDSAARRNEAFQIKKDGLLEGNKANEVIGKRGKKYKPVYLNDTKELIKQYLEQRGEDNIESLWFVGKGENKRPITYNAIYDRIVSMSKVLSELEGKEIQFFPHSLRHSRCEVLNQGLDTRITDENGNPKKFKLEEIKFLLNHSSVSVTEMYAKDHSEETVDNMFGLGSKTARQENVPIVNYGVLIAYVHGILPRALSPFPEIQDILAE